MLTPRRSGLNRSNAVRLTWCARPASHTLLLGLSLVLLTGREVRADGRDSTLDARGTRVQRLTDVLRARLSIPQQVVVALVDSNPLVASVQPMKGRRGVFLLSMERGFVEALSEDELEAVVAHELGHVWIYSHHPFLQTEQLANRIAMRLVTRDSLEHVYRRLWGASLLKGSLESFLGLPLPAKEASAARSRDLTESPRAVNVPK